MTQWKLWHCCCRGVVDVMNGEISYTLGYVLQHLVVNIQAINTVNYQHPEWHPSYVIECMCDDLLRSSESVHEHFIDLKLLH